MTSQELIEFEAAADPVEPVDDLVAAARDPSKLGFPTALPMELAMKIGTPKDVCKIYGITQEQFRGLVLNPTFVKAYQDAVEKLKIEGMSFKMRAQLQAEDLLGTSFGMIKNPVTSDAVRADLIKSTVRWAGYDAKAAEANSQPNFNILINLA